MPAVFRAPSREQVPGDVQTAGPEAEEMAKKAEAARERYMGGEAAQVTESARTCSYSSTSQVQNTWYFWLLS